LDPIGDTAWDQLVATHPDSTVFHSGAWARVLSTSYGHKPIYLCYRRQNEVVALFPMMEVNSTMTGRRGVCLPFTDYCPPLIFQDATSESLINPLAELATKRRWNYFALRGRLPGTVGDATRRFYGHTLSLAGGLDVVLSGFISSVRRALRRAERSNLSVSIEHGKQALLAFYQLHIQTRRRHGLPPQPLSFFLNIHREILESGLGFIVLASTKVGPAAAALFFRFGQSGIFKYGASDLRIQEMRPNNLVMWHGIQLLAQSGCERLHFGRTAINNQGLRRFKLGWGAIEETIEYFQFGSRGQPPMPATDRTTGLHNVLFRTLPSSLNRLAGAIIYPHLD
jgi:hypothetical protein